MVTLGRLSEMQTVKVSTRVLYNIFLDDKVATKYIRGSFKLLNKKAKQVYRNYNLTADFFIE